MVVKKIQGYIQHLISSKLGNHPFGLLANWVQTRGSSSARYPRSDCRKMPQTQLLSYDIAIFLMYIGSSVIVLFRQIQPISVLSEIYSVLWSVGRQVKFSCISTACVFDPTAPLFPPLYDIFSLRVMFFLFPASLIWGPKFASAFLEDPASSLDQSFLANALEQFRKVSLPFPPDMTKYLKSEALALGKRDNVLLTHSPIIFKKFSALSMYEFSVKRFNDKYDKKGWFHNCTGKTNKSRFILING